MYFNNLINYSSLYAFANKRFSVIIYTDSKFCFKFNQF